MDKHALCLNLFADRHPAPNSFGLVAVAEDRMRRIRLAGVGHSDERLREWRMHELFAFALVLTPIVRVLALRVAVPYRPKYCQG